MARNKQYPQYESAIGGSSNILFFRVCIDGQWYDRVQGAGKWYKGNILFQYELYDWLPCPAWQATDHGKVKPPTQ